MTFEHDLINRYFAPLCSTVGEAPAFGLLDDTALLQPAKGRDILLTTDALVAGVHFFPKDPPASIARKALGVNVSDIVAKGGLPRNYLLSIALPKQLSEDWLAEFAKGLHEAQRFWQCELIGGDTVSTSGPLTLSITLVGDVEEGCMVRRKGAVPGDIVFVSNNIGDAALGLLLRLGDERMSELDLSKEHAGFLRHRYLYPAPDIKLAPLVGEFASAAMDISDGLMGDCAKLCVVSNVGALIEAAKNPAQRCSGKRLAQVPDLLETVLTGGDDYEVLLTVPALSANEFEKDAENVTRIGIIVAHDEGVKVLDEHGQPLDLPHRAFDHFGD